MTFILLPNPKRQMTIGGFDHPFVMKVREVIESRLNDPNLNTDCLCDCMAMSRSPLYSKLRKHTGMSATAFIRYIRLSHAAGLLAETNLNVSEIAYQVGFQTPNYFTRRFSDLMGCSPSDFRSSQQDCGI